MRRGEPRRGAGPADAAACVDRLSRGFECREQAVESRLEPSPEPAFGAKVEEEVGDSCRAAALPVVVPEEAGEGVRDPRRAAGEVRHLPAVRRAHRPPHVRPDTFCDRSQPVSRADGQIARDRLTREVVDARDDPHAVGCSAGRPVQLGEHERVAGDAGVQTLLLGAKAPSDARPELITTPSRQRTLESAKEGDYSVRVNLRPNDFLVAVADSLNEFMGDLEERRLATMDEAAKHEVRSEELFQAIDFEDAVGRRVVVRLCGPRRDPRRRRCLGRLLLAFRRISLQSLRESIRLPRRTSPSLLRTETVRAGAIGPSPCPVGRRRYHRPPPRPIRAGNSLRVGAWRSLVAHLHGVQGVGGSNPLAPTNSRMALLGPEFDRFVRGRSRDFAGGAPAVRRDVHSAIFVESYLPAKLNPPLQEKRQW